MPFNSFVRPGAAVDEQSQPSGKDDVKGFYWVILATEHVASIQPAHGSVGYQPLQLRSGR
jgi:hypothetical protein